MTPTLLRMSTALAALLPAFLAVLPATVHAETFHTCAGFIDSIPATITTQGVWCLRQDVATTLATGDAIHVDANNVIIDCNGFKIGGLAAGAGTTTVGIRSLSRGNIGVRNCSIRGFSYGVQLDGEVGGHLVEDNRLDGNTFFGILVSGDGSLVRRNRVLDTGGSTVYPGAAYGIFATYDVDIADNIVSNVLALPSATDVIHTYGIYTQYNDTGTVSGNHVSGLSTKNGGNAVALYNYLSGRLTILQNVVVGPTDAGIAIRCANALGRAVGNVVHGFAVAIQGCADGGGNSL